MPGDIRHSIRILLKNPRFTTLAIAVLAVGIGATSVVFTLTYSVLLKPLPYAVPDRLTVIMEGIEHHASEGPMPAADYLDFRQQNQLRIHGRGRSVESRADRR